MERQHMKCILKVDTRSSGWEKSVTKVIKCVKDVSYTIDTTRGVVHISGVINPQKLLTDIKKAGKHAELLVADCVGNSHYHSHSHSNYGSHGYHGYDGGYGYSDPHHQTYHHHHHHHQSRPGGYLSHHNNAHVLPSAPPLLQWHPQSFSPPKGYEYDSYNQNPSCNIM